MISVKTYTRFKKTCTILCKNYGKNFSVIVEKYFRTDAVTNI